MSKKLDILDCKGAVVGEYELPENCFELEKGAQAVHDVVVAFLAGERSGSASTKTRAERRGGGAKPFRQKGLGRARSGSIRNPIWRKGGIIFGPKPRSYDKDINKKVRKLALKRALSERIDEGSVIVLDKFDIPDHKTKSAKAVVNSLKVESNFLLAVPEYEKNVVCATGNLSDCVLRKASSVNVYELLRFSKLIITKDAMDEIVQRMA